MTAMSLLYGGGASMLPVMGPATVELRGGSYHARNQMVDGRYTGIVVGASSPRRSLGSRSAAERAVMAFKTLPNATVVGDTTNGSTSTKIPRELANGWHYALTPQLVQMFDGLSYEERGIAPDLVVKNDLGEMRAGIDRVLQTAIDLLR
jgi:hypothetical protein